MPIYAYHCRDCGEDFETLVRGGGRQPARLARAMISISGCR
jgi:putative FmdB family regulatory protein